MTTHGAWFATFLGHIGAPAHSAQLRTLAAVSIFESSQGDLPWWNPLAVVTPVPESTPLYPHATGSCAQIYPSVAAGMAASVDLFLGPHWADVRQALRRPTNRFPMLDAFSAAYTWARVDFRRIGANTGPLDARRAHPLRGPS